MKRRNIVMMMACIGFLGAMAEEKADSTAGVNLKEVVVQGKRAWIEGNKAIFLPTKKEKNLANDPASLVDRMSIPTVIVEGGTIKTLAGQSIPIFINGVEAQGIDLTTFWPKHTIRVEYIDHPTDPQFKGYSAVLNFIMEEYEVGGVTKLNGSQNIPNSGNYNASSKLVYKDMTYAINIVGGYSRNHSDRSIGQETYNGIYYDGIYYDKITREYEQSSYSRSDNIGASFNARYRKKDKLTILHQASLLWNRDPGSGSTYTERWSPDLFGSSGSSNWNNSRKLSPQIMGSYGVQLTPRSFVAGSWEYKYAHNDQNSGSATGELAPILNSNEENSHAGNLTLRYNNGFRQDSKFFLGTSLNSSFNSYNILYGGSVNTDYRQWRGTTNASATLHYTFSPKIMVGIAPGISLNYWKSGSADRHVDVYPTANAYIYWNPSNKFSANTTLSYAIFSPSAAESSDILIRQSELMWVRGSNDLHDKHNWYAHLSLNWIPFDFLRFGGFISYTYQDNNTDYIYEAAPADMGGVIKTYVNMSRNDGMNFQGHITLHLLNNNLRLSLNPELDWNKYTGTYAKSHAYFRMRNHLSYTLGNTEFTIGYWGGQRYYSNNGREYNRSHDTWSFDFTYGQGDIYFSLTVDDIFNKRSHSETRSLPGVVMTDYTGYGIGRNLSLRLTYTFGYGKKVDRNIEISGPSEAVSGALSR